MRNLSVAEMHSYLQKRYGNVVKFPGMLAKRDMLFCFNPIDYEKIFRTEGLWPLRRGLDCFDYYRTKVRPDVFGGIGGLVTDQGELWHNMRTLSNPVMLRPKAVMSYLPAVDEVTLDFLAKIRKLRDANGELPADFANEISFWTLELIGVMALDTRLGVLSEDRSPGAERLIKVMYFCTLKNNVLSNRFTFQANLDFFRLSYNLEVKPSLWRIYKTKEFRELLDALDVMTE